ncbi:MAG: hypothetical protein SRB1_02639 [Desulfobacteraceae bacterium Eth-SRB1]|nr:MAG: hypothetical protein SRB1_02639 [Desulfobacteraceae bacterium Eth-SRB1]
MECLIFIHNLNFSTCKNSATKSQKDFNFKLLSKRKETSYRHTVMLSIKNYIICFGVVSFVT